MFWLRFAFRSCLRRRRRTVITLLGIAFGVGTLIVLGAIMTGVNDTMVENAIALHSGRLVVEGKPAAMQSAVEQARRWAEYGRASAAVSDAMPRCRFPAFLNGDKRSLPCQLWCVDPESEARVSPIPGAVTAGSYLKTDGGFLLGTAAARELDLDLGDSVMIVTPQNNYKLRITGLFETGVHVLDRSVAYVPIATAGDFDESQVTMETPFFCSAGTDLEPLKASLQRFEPDATVFTWKERLPEVAQLVDLNEFAMDIMALLVVAVLGFGVANALLISVMDRYRYYAILKAIGARPSEVVVTVLAEAVIMCLGAGLAGTAIGVAASLAWGQIGLDIGRYTSFNPHFSINSVVHPRLTLIMALGPQALSLGAGALASLWPALVAARRSVSSGMRDL